jgi:hypothetical protein
MGLGNTAPETRGLHAAPNRYLAAGSTAGSCLLNPVSATQVASVAMRSRATA